MKRYHAVINYSQCNANFALVSYLKASNRFFPAAWGIFVLSLCCFSGKLFAADNQALPLKVDAEELRQLKRELSDQRKQLDALRQMVERQQALLEKAAAAPSKPASLGEVATTTPMLPSAVPAAVATPSAFALPAMRKESVAQEPSPLSFRIGSAYLTPIGFMDFITENRSTNAGGGTGSNFGSVPYRNVSAGRLSESRFSAQNSRIGLRVDAMVKDALVLGYLESDFLGFVPTNATVSSNSISNRLRLFWVDVRSKKFEMLAGQSWSFMTPNRKGLSALPSDLFYSQDIDTNYQAGLTWGRSPGIRFLYHPTATVALGVALESPEQYIGGSGGGGVITIPSALATPYATQLNAGNTTISAPSFNPDIIAKIAFDPKLTEGRAFHLEFAGLARTFRTFNPLTQARFTTQGYGGSLNMIVEPVKNFRLISTNFLSDGGGRYIFGQAPDLIVRGDGSVSPVHASSTVDGFETNIHNLLLYGYYGGVYIGRNVAIDPATGKSVGYGYSGSANSQNRTIQEGTVGFNQTLWKSPQFGALNMMGQYSYIFRNPWSVAAGTLSNTHLHLVMFNLRYTLPGAAPSLK